MIKLNCTKEEFITNETLLTKYSERQLIAMHEMLFGGMFEGTIVHLLKKDKLADIKEDIMGIMCSNGRWNDPGYNEKRYIITLK